MTVVFIHLKVTPSKISSALNEIKKIDYIKEAYVVTGDYDIIAKLETPDASLASKIIIEKILKIDGVERSSSSIVLPQTD
ncbi:MAG: Lrp/AsnC ligand binding domain-containing protein [Candidatus Odinarchaeum yellowstonii]|uniref:Lrp/AsnC ligand binding domain-containing protein n=1 Tax=Odinarchaeota yellowstonii (strain LCB_4) TaxID=1841599 RepID=A0AAF0D1F1_ODILC|nr:MAG: Lrp/AsnC ligand binding domain-containing protein [Candidatus Odinarchaeum yellowstonii]